MRAPFSSTACFMLLLCHPSLVLCHQEGYYAEEGYQDDILDVEESAGACPTDRVLRARDTCRAGDAEIECIRLHCCDTHRHIAGRNPMRRKLNAKLGKRDGEELRVGKFGVGIRNHRGHLLAGFMEKEGLYMMNSFFRKREHRKWTWMSPDGATKNEIDFIMSTKRHIFNDVSVINTVKTGSDHRLKSNVMKSTLRPVAAQLQNPESFQLELQNRFDCLGGDVDEFNDGCISKEVEPCSLNLCEQACEARGERLWCSCHAGYRFHADNYRRRTQPYCVDVDECASNNGACEYRCVNDPGGFHCECPTPQTLASDGRTCARPIVMPEPLPLIRASSRCYAPCDTVSWLTRKVRALTDQLHTTQAALKNIMENPVFKDGDQFSDSTYAYRVLDATAPLEGGYCRCERGPRGPPGAPGVEGPKGDAGVRGPRGARGPKGSMDLMLLLLADIRHDINNLEARVYGEGEHPQRFDLQKAWRRQRKQERMDKERRTDQELEAYTVPPIVTTRGPVDISPNGLTGEITHDSDSESTTDWSMVKGETEPSDLSMQFPDMDDKLLEFHLLANSTHPEDDEDLDTDYEYSFY